MVRKMDNKNTILFSQIFEQIRTEENYTPRNYKTMGGMWTVDTWKSGDTTIQLMDEGYTRRILTNVLDIYDTVNKIEFKKGNEKDLEQLFEETVLDKTKKLKL